MAPPVRPAFVALLLAALVLTSCGGRDLDGPARTPTASAPGEGGLPSWMPSGTPGDDQPGGSDPPGGEATPPPEEETPPTGDDTPPPGEETPAPTEEPGGSPTPAAGAAACTGNVDNRTFFEHIAGQVEWDLYCAVLPPRWFVENGQFSLRDGGRIEVSYKGPGGARLTLQEGNYCRDGVSACSPRDQALGDASFGDRAGGLVSLGPDDGFAIYVDPGQAPSWTATGTALDQATFVSLVAALHRIEP